jgi:hypothetical protein
MSGKEINDENRAETVLEKVFRNLFLIILIAP